MNPVFSPRRVFAMTLLGALFIQAAWILATPTYRGIDEFDHVFKAESVARGQWLPRTPAPDGRGSLVTVHRATVNAATDVCEYYKYTGPSNCRPVRSAGPGLVRVATAAGSYNPVYYLVVGIVAKPFSGDAADYAMRAVTAILCALMLAWASALLASWARTIWPMLALLIGITPVFGYSTAIASPNGLSYAGATLIWMSALALQQRRDNGRRIAPAALVGTVALVTTHTTGPMWLALIGLTLLVLFPLRSWTSAFRLNPGVWTGTFLLMGLATASSMIWTRVSHANALNTVVPGVFDLAPDVYSTGLKLWLFQGIAVFPTLNERAPAPVYVIFGLLLLATLVFVVRRSQSRERWAMGFLIALAFAVPLTITTLTYASEGLAWQGRYNLPIWLGVTAVTCLVANRIEKPLPPIAGVIVVALTSLSYMLSIVGVATRETSEGPTAPASAAIPGGNVLLVSLVVASAVALVLGTTAARPPQPSVPTGDPIEEDLLQ